MNDLKVIQFNPYPKVKPRNRQNVVWIWSRAGHLETGYYFNSNAYSNEKGKILKSTKTIFRVLPDYWFDMDNFWPKD